MHLIKPPRIAGQILDAQRFATNQALGRPIVGIVPVEIGLIGGDGRAKTERRLRSCSTGIFPLSLRRYLRHQPRNLLAKRLAKLDHILEILNLSTELRKLIEPQDIEDAEACVEVLDAVRSFGTICWETSGSGARIGMRKIWKVRASIQVDPNRARSVSFVAAVGSTTRATCGRPAGLGTFLAFAAGSWASAS